METIQENLRAMAAGEMKTFIEQAEKLQIDNAAKKVLIEGQHLRIKELVVDHEKLNKQIIAQSALDERELKCGERELEIRIAQFDLDKKLLEVQLKMTEKSNNNIHALVEKVFGHPSVRVETSKNNWNSRTGSNGMTEGSDSESGTETVITREEKT